jgi:transcriptional regulator of acetoin/glycerol metabolism
MRQNLWVLVLIGKLIRWSLSLRKRAKSMADLIKLTNLLVEAGLSPTAVARQLGLGRSTVYREVKLAGVRRSPL